MKTVLSSYRVLLRKVVNQVILSIFILLFIRGAVMILMQNAADYLFFLFSYRFLFFLCLYQLNYQTYSKYQSNQSADREEEVDQCRERKYTSKEDSGKYHNDNKCICFLSSHLSREQPFLKYPQESCCSSENSQEDDDNICPASCRPQYIYR